MRTQDFHIFTPPTVTNDIVTLVNQLLISHEFSIVVNGLSFIRLYDYEIGDEEFYFTTEDITDPKKDLLRLKRNPKGGCISYEYLESEVLISFNTVDCDLDFIDMISASFQYQIYKLHKEKIDILVKKMHDTINGLRTIGGENLSDDIDIEKEALLETKSGYFKKKYPIDYL